MRKGAPLVFLFRWAKKKTKKKARKSVELYSLGLKDSPQL